jgi:hypothetical protein
MSFRRERGDANMDESRIPVIVGVGQFTQKPAEIEQTQEPFEMIKTCISRAQEDTGVQPFFTWLIRFA